MSEVKIVPNTKIIEHTTTKSMVKKYLKSLESLNQKGTMKSCNVHQIKKS